jgi:hypothetical protein
LAHEPGGAFAVGTYPAAGTPDWDAEAAVGAAVKSGGAAGMSAAGMLAEPPGMASAGEPVDGAAAGGLTAWAPAAAGAAKRAAAITMGWIFILDLNAKSGRSWSGEAGITPETGGGCATHAEVIVLRR